MNARARINIAFSANAQERTNIAFSGNTQAHIIIACRSNARAHIDIAFSVYANARTALEAQSGIRRAFVVAFRSGAVMGFLLPALGLAVLFAIILVYKKVRACC